MNYANIKVGFVHEFSDHLAGQEISLVERLVKLRDLGIECEVLLPGRGCFYEHLRKLEFKVHLYRKQTFPRQ